jgi:hypothetical protein
LPTKTQASCHPISGTNYSSIIYSKNGNELKRFSNEHCTVCNGSGNDEDNSLYISSSEYPITVSINYKVCAAALSNHTNGKFVAAKVKVLGPCILSIEPRN